jgi:SHS2 domain-containing protein
VVGGRNLSKPRYELIDHTADIAIVARGDTLPDLFENAAFGLFDVTFDLADAAGTVERRVAARGDTVEELLVGWLSALLAESEIAGLVFAGFTVDRLEEGGVEGTAAGSPVAGVDLVGSPVKAVTYYDLAVVEGSGGWWARLVFDV